MPADNIWYFSRDPDDPVQRIVVPPEAGDSILVVPSPVVSNPKPANELFQKALQVAGKEVDDRISLSTNRDRVTEYLSLFVDPPPRAFTRTTAKPDSPGPCATLTVFSTGSP